MSALLSGNSLARGVLLSLGVIVLAGGCRKAASPPTPPGQLESQTGPQAADVLASTLPGVYGVRIQTTWIESDGWTCTETLDSEGPALEVKHAEGTWRVTFFGQRWTGSTSELRSLRLSMPWNKLDPSLRLLNIPSAVAKAELGLSLAEQKFSLQVTGLENYNPPEAGGVTGGATMPAGAGMPGMAPTGMPGMAGMPDGAGPTMSTSQPSATRNPGYVRFEATLINKSQEAARVVTSGDLLAGEVKRLVGHRSGLLSLRVSPDGEQVWSTDADGIALRWPLQARVPSTLPRASELGCFPGFVEPLADGKRVLSAGGRGAGVQLRLWDPAAEDRGQRFELRFEQPADETAQKRASWTMHFADMAVSADGRRGLTVALYGRPFMTVWDIRAGQPLCTVPLAPAERTVDSQGRIPLQGGGAVALSGDGRRALANGMIWDVDSKRVLGTAGPKALVSSLRSFAFSPNDTAAAIGYSDRSILLWDVASGKQAGTCLGGESVAVALAFSRDGKRLLSCGEDGVTRLWEAASGQALRHFRWRQSAPGDASPADSRRGRVEPGVYANLHAIDRAPVRVALTPDGRLGLSSEPDGTIHVWDLEKADAKTAPIPSVQAIAATRPDDSYGETVIAESPDGKYLLLDVAEAKNEPSPGAGVVRIWDVRASKAVRDLKDPDAPNSLLPADRLASAAFSTNGDLLATAVLAVPTPRLWLWRLQQERPLRAVAQAEIAGVLRFTADGRYLMAHGRDGLSFLDAGNLQVVHTFQGVSHVLALSRDGHLLAAEMASESKFAEDSRKTSKTRKRLDDIPDEPVMMPGGMDSRPGGIMPGAFSAEPVIVVGDIEAGREICRINPTAILGTLPGEESGPSTLSPYTSAMPLGTMPGVSVGSMPGALPGSMAAPMPRSRPSKTRKSTSSSMLGSMPGAMPGPMPGSMPLPTYGAMPGKRPWRMPSAMSPQGSDLGGPVGAAAFSPNGRYVFCAVNHGSRGAIGMVEVMTGQVLRRFVADRVRQAKPEPGKDSSQTAKAAESSPSPGMPASASPSAAVPPSTMDFGPVPAGAAYGYGAPGSGPLAGGRGADGTAGQGTAALPILFTCLDVAPSGRLLAAGTTTGTVYVFDIDKQRQLAKVAALTQPVSSVAFGDELSLMVGVAPSEPADQAGPDTAPMTVATAAGPAGALRYRFRWPDGPALARDAEPPSDAQLPSVEFSGSSTVATPGKTAPTPDARPRRELLAEVRSIPLAKSPGLPAPGAPTTEPAPGMYPGMSPAARPVPDFCFLLLPDGRRAVSRGKDEQLHVVDFSNGQSVGTLENSREAEPVWSDGDNALAVTGAKGPTGPTQPSAFEKWEVATGRWLGRAYFFKAAPAQAAPAMPPGTMPEMMMPSGPPAPSPRGASCWAVFPSKEYGQYAVLADGDTASVVKLDRFARPAATSKPSKKTPPPPSCSFQKSISVPGNGISALAALSDGRTFLAGCNDGSISVCDAPGGRIVRTWAKQSSRITVLVVSADGTKVISLAASTPASGMSAPGRKRSRAAEEFDMSAPSMAEMPRYGALPTPGPSRLWNIADGTEIHTLARPASVVALAPDASLAVSAAGKDLSLWELKGGEEIARVLLHGNAQRVEFLPDGIHVLALSDESLTFWRLHASIRPKPVTPPNAETGGAEPAEEAGAKRPPDKKS